MIHQNTWFGGSRISWYCFRYWYGTDTWYAYHESIDHICGSPHPASFSCRIRFEASGSPPKILPNALCFTIPELSVTHWRTTSPETIARAPEPLCTRFAANDFDFYSILFKLSSDSGVTSSVADTGLIHNKIIPIELFRLCTHCIL